MNPFDPLSPAAVASATASLADAVPRVYWTDPHERPQLRTAPRTALGPGPHRADLVVIGGGFTGLWAAIQALEADPGRSVVVIESELFGHAASGRNGGFVSPSLTHGLLQGLACWPSEIPTLRRLALENLAGWEGALAAYGIKADYHRPGELTIAVAEHQRAAVAESYEVHAEHGIAVERLDADQTRERVDSPVYLEAVYNPETALVDPGLLVHGLARAAESLGARLVENDPVIQVERDGAGLAVHTTTGTIHCDQAVLGTGAFRGILRRIALLTLPVYDHVLMTEPLTSAQLAAIGWTGREGLGDAGNQFHYYRRTLDDRILFGGYDANYHFPGRIERSLEQSASHDLLAAHFFTIFPQLEGVRFSHRWGGVIDTTSRFTPVFGTTHGGRLAYAVGYTGLGVASTRFGARVALDLLSGVATERTELGMVRDTPVPFPPEPLRSAVVRLTRNSLAAEDRTGQRNLWLKALDKLGVGFDS